MAIMSSTGTGRGAASKGLTKGSAEQSISVEKLFGTRVVLGGRVTLSSGAATVAFPTTLPGVATDYIVVASVMGSSASAVAINSFATTGFAVVGTGSAVVAYAVIKVVSQ